MRQYFHFRCYHCKTGWIDLPDTRPMIIQGQSMLKHSKVDSEKLMQHMAHMDQLEISEKTNVN